MNYYVYEKCGFMNMCSKKKSLNDSKVVNIDETKEE